MISLDRSQHLAEATHLPATGPLPLPNAGIFGSLMFAQRSGKGCLPERLGLQEPDYFAFLNHFFPGIPEDVFSVNDELGTERSALRQQLLEARWDEYLVLRDLLLDGRSGRDVSEAWLAAILAAGCMGNDHLWRDLGLNDRGDLSDILQRNFAPLTQRNQKNMRWKKFFYKQLCESEGDYICRAPSCDQCTIYHQCFGEEL